MYAGSSAHKTAYAFAELHSIHPRRIPEIEALVQAELARYEASVTPTASLLSSDTHSNPSTPVKLATNHEYFLFYLYLYFLY